MSESTRAISFYGVTWPDNPNNLPMVLSEVDGQSPNVRAPLLLTGKLCDALKEHDIGVGSYGNAFTGERYLYLYALGSVDQDEGAHLVRTDDFVGNWFEGLEAILKLLKLPKRTWPKIGWYVVVDTY